MCEATNRNRERGYEDQLQSVSPVCRKRQHNDARVLLICHYNIIYLLYLMLHFLNLSSCLGNRENKEEGTEDAKNELILGALVSAGCLLVNELKCTNCNHSI